MKTVMNFRSTKKLVGHTKRFAMEAELYQFQSVIDELDNGKKIKKYTCFSCFDPILRMTPRKMPEKHRDLGVSICVQCHSDLYDAEDEFTFTDGKMDYCCITADGGNVVSCDKCERSYSEDVLKKWLGEKETKALMEDEDAEFVCFKCNPELGRYPMFLEHTGLFEKAYDKEYEADIEPKVKRVRIEKSSGTRSRSRKINDPVESDSESGFEIELRKRDKKSKYEEEDSDAESTVSDYVFPEEKKTEKISVEQLEEYWNKRINRVSEKYKDNKFHKALLATLNGCCRD